MHPAWILGAALAVVLAGVVWGIGRDRRRGRAFAALGSGIGLRYEREGDAAYRQLASLPMLEAPGRHAFPHALVSEDEVCADWRIVGRPKDRPRKKIHTILARRRPDMIRAPGAAFARASEQRVDEGPGSFGRYVVETGGEWIACRLVSGRVPADRLAEFRERAHLWLDRPPASTETG